MTKKRHKARWVILIILILLMLLIGAVLFFLHQGKNSDAVKEYEKQITQQTETMTNDLLDQVSAGTQSVIAEVDEADASEGNGTTTPTVAGAGDPPDAQGGTASEGKDGKSAGKNTATGMTQAERQAQLEQRLEEYYHGILMNQKAEAIGMIESLLGQAKSDYSALVASGKKNPTSLGNLVSQYMGKVEVMEGQMDASFNALVGKMEEELKAQGIDSSAMISQFKTEYAKIKEENRSYFMDLAWSQIK